jgi:hypothetical protein
LIIHKGSFPAKLLLSTTPALDSSEPAAGTYTIIEPTSHTALHSRSGFPSVLYGAEGGRSGSITLLFY